MTRETPRGTFTTEQVKFGRPTNPDYLLRPGELLEVFAGWDVLKHRQFTGPSRRTGQMRAVEGIIARKPV